MAQDNEPSLEFGDYEGESSLIGADIAWRRLLGPASLRGLAMMAGGVFLLFSDRSVRTLAVVLAAVVIVWGLTNAATALGGPESGRRLVMATALVAFGVILVVWPSVTGRILSRLLGSALIAAAAYDVFRAVRLAGPAGRRQWLAIRGLFAAALGAALWLAPDVLLDVVLALVGAFWVVAGFAMVVSSVSDAAEEADTGSTWRRFFLWLEQRPNTVDDRAQLYAKLFFEGDVAKRRLSRFFMLMGFATMIAAFGIVSDSTAVVIGAMLVAPLMTPLMGTSLSLVMGWPKRATMSLVVAGSGVALAIGLSVVFGAVLPFDINPVTNSQVASRVSPTLVDLLIAVAAGGAGAFALSRPDVSDALPGVAVAIALVPPLSVVGLMLESGNGADALGAMLLFTTNLVAILLVGAGVFVLTGVVPVHRLLSERDRVRNSAVLIGILAVAVVAVLGSTGDRIRTQAYDQDEVQQAVSAWIGDRALELFSVDIERADVEIVVVGEEAPGPVDELAAALEAELGRELVVLVRWVPEQQFVSDGTGG